MGQEKGQKKPWGGRFSQPTARVVEEFTASIGFDREFYAEDIAGSIAHARMLARQGIVAEDDARAMIDGLERIRREIEAGEFRFSVALEDIHMNIEQRLGELIGSEIAGRLHTGRSRNDQVALDLRLFLRRRIDRVSGYLLELMKALVEQARANLDVVMPGFTHLQQAQPVLFAHHMLAYFEMFKRDYQRLRQIRERCNVSPLGSGALAGSSFPLNREMVAEELQMAGVTANSLDAVSDRDSALETLFAFSLIMVHLSRICEELILWSTLQFDFVSLSDGFCTGSSIMPQKKNPDVPELIRGKSGRVIGSLVSLLILMKSLPLAYNKDMQEDKEPLIDALATVDGSLQIMADLIGEMRVKPERMRSQAGAGFSTATEVADYLVRKGLPFRQAHEIVGQVVAYCEKEGKILSDLNLTEWRSFSPLFDDTLFGVLAPEDSVNAKDITGGTASRQVLRQIEAAALLLEREEDTFK